MEIAMSWLILQIHLILRLAWSWSMLVISRVCGPINLIHNLRERLHSLAVQVKLNVTVDMMESASDYLYVDLTEELDAQTVALPYKVATRNY